MSITQTGNAEIDQQHEILDTMVARLESLCLEADRNVEMLCGACSLPQQQNCRNQLVVMVGKLGTFLVGHATYEERMMELLPATPACQAHIEAHKAAHHGIARKLKQLAIQVANEQPRTASIEVRRLLGTWLGDHSSLFDSRLVRMTKSASPEIDFDSELVTMLDRHVFPNRPTIPVVSKGERGARQKAQTDVRTRFESLSPTQKNVFRLTTVRLKIE